MYKSIKIYSTTWCADCIRLKAFLESKNIPYELFDIEKEPQYVELVQKLNNGSNTVPTVVVTMQDDSEKVTAEPTNEQMAQILGISL